MKQEKITIIIIIIALCLSFFINSIMFGWEATRRSADDVVKINESNKRTPKNSSEEIQSCLDGGGLPDYFKGEFVDCKKNN